MGKGISQSMVNLENQENDKQEENHIKRQLLGKNKEYDKDTIHVIIESLQGIPSKYSLVSLHYIVVERNQRFQFGQKSEGRFIDNIKLQFSNNNYVINQEFQLSNKSLLKRENKDLFVFVKIALSTDEKEYFDFGWTVIEIKNTQNKIQYGRFNAPMYDINYQPFDFFLHSVPQISRVVMRYVVANDENKKLFQAQKQYDMQGIHLYRDLSFNKNQKIFKYQDENNDIRFQDKKLNQQTQNTKNFQFNEFTDIDENKKLQQYQSNFQDFQFQDKAYHKKDGKKKLSTPVPQFDQNERYHNFGKDVEMLKKLTPNLNNHFPFYQDTYEQLGIPNPRPGNIIPIDVLQAPKNQNRKFQSQRERKEYLEKQRKYLLKKHDEQVFQDELYKQNLLNETTDSQFVMQQQRIDQLFETPQKKSIMFIEDQKKSNIDDKRQSQLQNNLKQRMSKLNTPQKNRRTLAGNQLAINDNDDPSYVDILQKSIGKEDRLEIEEFLRSNKNLEDEIIEEKNEEKEESKQDINVEELNKFEKENQYKQMRAVFQEKKTEYIKNYRFTHFSYQVVVNKLSHYKFKEWLKLDMFIMVRDKLFQGKRGKDCKFSMEYYEEPKHKQVVFELDYVFEIDFKQFRDKNQDDLQQMYLILVFYKQEESIPFAFYSHQLFNITKQQANLLKNNSLATKEFADFQYQAGKFPKEKLFRPPVKYPPYKKDVRRLKKLDHMELDIEIREYGKIQEHLKTQEDQQQDDSNTQYSIPGISHIF